MLGRCILHCPEAARRAFCKLRQTSLSNPISLEPARSEAALWPGLASRRKCAADYRRPHVARLTLRTDGKEVMKSKELVLPAITLMISILLLSGLRQVAQPIDPYPPGQPATNNPSWGTNHPNWGPIHPTWAPSRSPNIFPKVAKLEPIGPNCTMVTGTRHKEFSLAAPRI